VRVKNFSVPFLRVTPSAEDLLGEKASIDGVVERLKGIAPSQVFATLSTISAWLYQRRNDGVERDLKTQGDITRFLFPAGANGVLKGVLDWFTNDSRGALPGLFHELQLINMAKVACIVGADWQPHASKNPDAMGEALLMLNDLISSPPEGDPSSSMAWQEYFSANAHFHHRDNQLHEQARTHELYFGSASGSPDPRSLHSRTTRLLGTTARDYWVTWQLFSSYWQTLFMNDAVKSPILNTAYYAQHLSLPPATVDLYRRLVARDVRAVVERCKRDYTLTELRPYHFDALREAPILLLDDGNAVCPSVHLLNQRPTRGLFDSLWELEAEPQRQNLASDLGEAFNRYIGASLARSFGARAGHVYVPDQLLEAALRSKKVCDAAVKIGDTVVVFENKAIMFAGRVRAMEGTGKFITQSKEMFVESARQLHATIEDIRAGRLKAEGLDPADVRKFVPVSVILEHSPVSPFTGPDIHRRVREAGFLESSDVAPLTVLDAGDVDFLEPLARRGRDLAEVLVKKAAEAPWENLPAFALAAGLLKKGDGNEYLAAVFNSLNDDVAAWCREHSVAGGSWARNARRADWRPPSSPSDPAGTKRKKVRKAQRAARKKNRR
jgi:hypothetical protein